MRPFDRIRKRLPEALRRGARKPRQHSSRTVARYRRMRALGVLRYRYLAAVPLLLIAIVVVAWIKLPPLETGRYRPVGYALNNPLMGWAVPADVPPDEVEEPHTLVHATLTWREFEPEEGVYDFDSFELENYMDIWREQGVRMILRFVMDEPSADGEPDIPDWLMASLGEAPGAAYQASFGSGFSPDYANDALIAAHAHALSALGARYDEDPLVAFVELGSVGHGGEWWVDTEAGAPPLPLLFQVRSYFGDYSAAFPKTELVAVAPYQSAKLMQARLYNPFLGDSERTWDWIDMANYGGYEPQLAVDLRGLGEAFRSQSSGAQFSRRVNAAAMLEQSPERILEQIRESHTGYISGAPATGLSERLSANMRIIREAMGYRLWLRAAQWQRHVANGESMLISIYIRNSGVAAMAQSWPVRLGLMDERREVVAQQTTNIDTRALAPGEHRYNASIDVPNSLAPGEYVLGIQIIDPMTGEPGVSWAMATERHGMTSIFGKVNVKR